MHRETIKVLGRDDLVIASIAGHASRPQYGADFLHLGVPIPECLCVSPGPVGFELIENLRILGYDQAPVVVPDSPIGWRLVTRERLSELHASCTPLGADPSHYEPDDTAEVEDIHVPLPTLLHRFVDRRALLVYSRETVSALDLGDLWPGAKGSWTELSVLGLITVSDLNRREVRKVACELLLDLETVLGELVGRRFKDSWDWVRHLGEPAQVRLLGHGELSRRRGIDTNLVESAMLPELLMVISRTEELRKAIGMPSGKEMEGIVRKIGDFRNRVMHPVRPFVLSGRDVRRMLDAVEVALRLKEQLRTVVEV